LPFAPTTTDQWVVTNTKPGRARSSDAVSGFLGLFVPRIAIQGRFYVVQASVSRPRHVVAANIVQLGAGFAANPIATDFLKKK